MCKKKKSAVRDDRNLSNKIVFFFGFFRFEIIFQFPKTQKAHSKFQHIWNKSGNLKFLEMFPLNLSDDCFFRILSISPWFFRHYLVDLLNLRVHSQFWEEKGFAETYRCEKLTGWNRWNDSGHWSHGRDDATDERLHDRHRSSRMSHTKSRDRCGIRVQRSHRSDRLDTYFQNQ